MSLLQDGVKEYSIGPELQRLLDIEQAAKVAKRFLGIKEFPQSQYMKVYASDDLGIGDVVARDVSVPDDLHKVRKWNGHGYVIGIVLSPMVKGTYGWIQIK
jgi:hypothetical protein